LLSQQIVYTDEYLKIHEQVIKVGQVTKIGVLFREKVLKNDQLQSNPM
jgi:hypothetical protein